MLTLASILTGAWGSQSGLDPEYYQFSCPQVNDIVMSVLEKATAKDPRMDASLLRLHFHDCFVQVNHICHIGGIFLLGSFACICDSTILSFFFFLCFNINGRAVTDQLCWMIARQS